MYLVWSAKFAGGSSVAGGSIDLYDFCKLPKLLQVGIKRFLQYSLLLLREAIPLFQGDCIAIEAKLSWNRKVVVGIFWPAGKVSRGGTGDCTIYESKAQGVFCFVK